MHSQISGGRADGTNWPPSYTPFQVPDAEGADLVRGGLGFEVPPPDRAGQEPPAREEPPRETVFREGQEPEVLENGPEVSGYPDAQTPAAEVPAAAAADPGTYGMVAEGAPLPDLDSQAPVAAPDPAAADPAAAAPKPADSKQVWVDYAVAQGRPVDVANAMTKADLMSQYGGRL